MITGMRCRVVGVSRIRVHSAYPCMTFHTGYRRPVPEVPFLKVAYTPARPTLGGMCKLEPPGLEPEPMCAICSILPTIPRFDSTSLSSVGVGGVHVFRANSLSRMFLVMACASHPRFPLLRLAKSLTGTCMFSMIWADTLAMSPYKRVVAHTCAAIPCAFGKTHGLLVGFALSSSSEPSLPLATKSPLSTWATHCFRDVLRIGKVSCKHCKTATPSCRFSIIMEYVMLGRCTLLYHVNRRPHATTMAGIGSSMTGCGGSCCLAAVLRSRSSRSTR
mmetsp:Transcript_68309/g.110874  ORF Transcript_68309/g.110874 Transcript_68309/m.110874 type:complete len:275 (-) Transcript_68309:1394-2218(-)